MDFELDNMEIIDNHKANPLAQNDKSNFTSQSLLFEELQKELEDYQQKLKLSHRRILLFEGENQKLIEEKNKLFFAMKDLQEKVSLYSEKHFELEKVHQKTVDENLFLKEKTETLQKINSTQLLDIKRFSKFHLKIQNVVKPYIESLKQRLKTATEELTETKNQNIFLESNRKNLETRIDTMLESHDLKVASYELNKTELIRSYEEQIHSFSKEIINNQQKQDDLSFEVQRLKKSVEYKNFYENEVIKFKRIHEEDQKQISDLKVDLEKIRIQQNDLIETKNQLDRDNNRASNQLNEKEHILEATRMQLSKLLEQESILNQRLDRLEKLNLHLSQQMRPISEELQKES